MSTTFARLSSLHEKTPNFFRYQTKKQAFLPIFVASHFYLMTQLIYQFFTEIGNFGASFFKNFAAISSIPPAFQLSNFRKSSFAVSFAACIRKLCEALVTSPRARSLKYSPYRLSYRLKDVQSLIFRKRGSLRRRDRNFLSVKDVNAASPVAGCISLSYITEHRRRFPQNNFDSKAPRPYQLTTIGSK